MTYNTKVSTDEKWMRRALALAAKGRGAVHPNPMVGAVLVRGGRVVGEGFHRQYGQPHAEVEAIRAAGPRAQGSTLYVNLEPCSHWGKTPPCAEAVVRAGIRRVVAAIKDPNPKVSGKGFALLRRHHLHVSSGLLEDQAREMNKAFLTWVRHHRPYVTLKAATSLDGRASTITGESQWITGPAARQAGHEMRSQVDAIAVGLGTILADNPSLTAHGKGRNPIRIVFDSRLRTPSGSRVLNREAQTWCLATDHTVLKHMDQFKRKGVHVVLCRADAHKRVAIADALKQLASLGIAHLLVEGGPTLQQSFLDAGLVDDVIWFIAPMIIGNVKKLKSAWHLKRPHIMTVGQDLCVRARL